MAWRRLKTGTVGSQLGSQNLLASLRSNDRKQHRMRRCRRRRRGSLLQRASRTRRTGDGLTGQLLRTGEPWRLLREQRPSARRSIWRQVHGLRQTSRGMSLAGRLVLTPSGGRLRRRLEARSPRRHRPSSATRQSHRPDHQPHRVPRRQPLPHVRREKERPIPVHRPVTFRHNQILANTLPTDPRTRNPRSADSATAP